MAGALSALNSFIENKRRIAKRQLSDLFTSPSDFAAMMGPRIDEDLSQQFDNPEAAMDLVAGPAGALAGVVKSRGGNWLDGAFNKFAPFERRRPLGMAPEERLKIVQHALNDNPTNAARYAAEIERLQNDAALNAWLDGPLTRYIKRDMASPEDPIRKLADSGILHVDPDALNFSLERARGLSLGGTKLAATDAGATWEGVTDSAILNQYAKYFRDPVYDPEWLRALPDEAPVYSLTEPQYLLKDTGLDHLLDELGNALQDTAMPTNLRLSSDQLKQMGIEKAVRHVNSINKWRETKNAAANRALAEKTQVVREYSEKNPKGLKWVELKPGTGDDAWSELEKQLKYEGDAMGHCVGGYCDDVFSGRSRIFSLRDQAGRPHVTVQVGKTGRPDPSADEALSILQIKGKANAKPADEYIPFVQDFVLNNPIGKSWNKVGDLTNTNLEFIDGAYRPRSIK